MSSPSGESRRETAPGADALGPPRRRGWLSRGLSLRGRDLAAGTAVGALVLVMFSSLLSGRVLFERDIAVLFHPQAEAFYTAVSQGSWPLWNPFPGFGEPMLANANTQVLYPPTWLLLLLRPAGYYSLYVLVHLVFGGLGLYALARHLGVSRPAALTGACVFVVSGPILSFVNVWNHFAGACWMPWVVLASLRALREGTPRSALVWGMAVAGQVFAGSPDLCILTVAATLAGWVAVADKESLWRRPRALSATIGLAVLTATALSAAQWLPTLAAARAGSRNAFPFEQSVFWSVHPLSLGQMLAPLPLREVVNYSPRGGELFEVWEPFLASLYLGAAASGLVAAALAAARPRAARVLTLFTTFTVLIALGRHTPAYALLTRALPPLTMFRFPAKVMALVSWSWALLVALGADEWWREPAGAWRRGALSRAGLLAAGLGAAALATVLSVAGGKLPFLGPPAEGGDEVSRHVVTSLLWGWLAVGLVAAAIAAAARGGRRLAVAVMLIAVADLSLAHRGLNTTAPAAFFRYRPEVLRLLPPGPPPRLFVWDYVVHRPKVEEMPLAEMLRVRPGFPVALGRALAYQAYLYPPSYARWGLYGGFDRDLLGLAPPALGDLVAVLSRLHGTAAYPHLLALGAVDAVLAMHNEARAGLRPLGQVESPLQRPIRAFAVPGALPRAYLVGEARAAEGAAALRMLLDPAFDSSKVVVLPDAPAAPGGPGERALRVTRDAPDRFEAEVAQEQPGWLVRVVTHDPGWRVEVDGAAAPLLRANHAFQGVFVPAGRHHVTIVYRPRPVLAGLALSLLAVPLVAIGLVLLRPPAPDGPAAPVPARRA